MARRTSHHHDHHHHHHWTQQLLPLFLLGFLMPAVALPGEAQMNEIPHQEGISGSPTDLSNDTLKSGSPMNKANDTVENWAWKFGHHLVELSKKITYLEEIKMKYSSAKLDKVNGTQMVRDMVKDIETMVRWKLEAVQRIVDTSEQAMKGHEFEENPDFTYNNAKKLSDNFVLIENKRFDNIPVNQNQSTIHVATNVYNEDILVLNAIKGSAYVDATFVSNYHLDPTLLWQYFGSVTGFLRNHPGVKWLVQDGETDIYDCRLRPWYIEAAASPKDMVILLDTSGSMTGLRQEIGKQVVTTLLDTLNGNDYVAVLQFSDKVRSVVECFDDMMVPANKKNVEAYKEKLDTLITEKIANFSYALTSAFELLKMYNESDKGSQCNQAIMIVTDGLPETYDEIFNHYNQPYRLVRIFSYLIGREVTEIREVKYMACAHRGYFAHVKTPAEVREQVEKYIPVMARPMVIALKHNFIWTPVYADVADCRYCETPKIYQLMTTVAAPVFDLNKTVKIKERILVNGTWIDREIEKQQASLLGVAGTDVPIKEILKLAPPYLIGVNGYPFIITNNGHVITHPDLRPFFGDLLKPDYSTVDLSEVEISNNTQDAWEKDISILELRKEMIDRIIGDTSANVKIHYDKMRRVIWRRHRYFYAPINKTPFSFAIALPKGYGEHKLKFEGNPKSLLSETLNQLKEDKKWRVHPDWVYCAYRYPGEAGQADVADNSPEGYLKYFLQRLRDGKDKYKFDRVKEPLNVNQTHSHYNTIDKNEYYCDMDLINNFLFDAKVTNVYGKKESLPLDTGNNNAGFARKNGVTLSFVATRSGLTRWDDLLNEDELGNMTEPHYIQIHNRAIDEIWYKRAVDEYFLRNDTFVFSVPFDATLQNDTFVTGSRAIFVEGQNAQVPVAVVGLQFKHSVFAETFFNYTSTCQNKNCLTNCSSDDLDCYLLDDNGFVVVSERYQNTGKFFGEIDGLIMQSLIVDGIYQGVRLYDFQGTCEDKVKTANAASYIMKPFQHILSSITWLWQKIALLWLQYNLYNWWNSDWLTVAAANDDPNPVVKYIEDHEMFKMKNYPCNLNFTLYRLNPAQLLMKPLKAKLTKCNPNGCDRDQSENSSYSSPFSVQQVPYTNLVLLAVDATCPCDSSQITSIAPTKIDDEDIDEEQRETNSSQCTMLKLKSDLYRKRPKDCFNYNEAELNITDCGRGSRLRISLMTLLTTTILTIHDFRNIFSWS